MKNRRAASTPCGDAVDQLLGLVKSNYELCDEDIIDQIIMILYSGYETVAKTSMMAIKYLHQNPKALQELRVS